MMAMLEADVCYQALRSRDARFDGKFFTAVVTTGIYCRPVCPAPTPKRPNVRFYACAAAAEEAGFRPCRRCRPETAPWTPAWQGSSATVARALRLLEQTVASQEDLAHLAARLGVSDRHLRRLFEAHLGASPIAVARTLRAHLARRLIDETQLSMAQIAFAAGYSSVRNFNDAIRASFRAAPTALRAKSKLGGSRSSSSAAARPLTIRLAYRPPLAWTSLMRFFAYRAITGVELVDGDAYHRTIRIGDQPGVIAIRPVPDKPQLELTVRHAEVTALGAIIDRVRRMFDLGADPMLIDQRLAADPLLKPAVHRLPGLRVPGCWDRFEVLVRAVVGQQISVAGARTLVSRLVERYGTPLHEPSAGLTHSFPTPAQLAAVDLSRAGMPRARGATLQRLARAVAGGDVDLDHAGAEELMSQLQAQPGIGPWTAQYIAMRGLGEPDMFLPGDLGVRRALAGNGSLPSVREVESRAESWRPWRAYAVMHLWNP